MASPKDIGVFYVPDARRVLAATKRVEQTPLDMRTARRNRPQEESASGSGFAAFVIVCLGPDDEPAPTDPSYWLQPRTFGDTDPDEIPEVLSAGTIELGWNQAEFMTESHGLHVGDVVWCERVTDGGGNARLLFNKVP